MRMEHSLEIECDADEVFSFLADPDNLPRWQSGLVELHRESETLGAGARHREVRTMLGKHVAQTLEVTVFEPGARLDLAVVEGPVRVTVSHTLTRLERGTRLTVVGTGDPGPLFRLAGPLIARAIRKQSKEDLARLKAILEAES